MNKIIDSDLITLELYFRKELVEDYEVEDEDVVDNMLDEWNSWVSKPLKTNKENLGLENNLECEKLVATLLNDCEHNWDDDEKPSFEYKTFGEWVLKHYNDSKDYIIDDSGAESFFISSDNTYLKVKIENELGEIKYETANAFDNVDQDEVLAYYLDDFI